MSWRQKLQWSSEKGKASFRGATFYVDVADTGVGRRNEMHVYPNTKGRYKDYVWAEDLGPEPQEFVIEGYVLQNLTNNQNHFPERDKLITALQTEGPGELIHPFYGKMRVSLMGKARIRESLTRDQGIARFTMTFAQFNEPIFKQQEGDFVNIVDTSALSAINAALDSFTDLMDTAGAFLGSLTSPITLLMNKVQDAVNSVKGAVASTISTAIGLVATAISLVDNLLSSPCDLANQILDAADSVLGLVGMAGEVVQGGIVGACSGVIRSESSSGNNVNRVTNREGTEGDVVVLDGTSIPETLGISASEEMASNANFDIDDITEESGRLPDEQENNLEIAINVIQTSMLANAAKMAIRVEYSSQEQMIETAENIAESFDNLIDRLGSQNDEINDPILFGAITDLRGKFIENMYEKYSGLAKQYDYIVGANVENALSVAYDKYSDLNRMDDIFDRNRVTIKHPGFLPSGDNLKLLDE